MVVVSYARILRGAQFAVHIYIPSDHLMGILLMIMSFKKGAFFCVCLGRYDNSNYFEVYIAKRESRFFLELGTGGILCTEGFVTNLCELHFQVCMRWMSEAVEWVLNFNKNA